MAGVWRSIVSDACYSAWNVPVRIASRAASYFPKPSLSDLLEEIDKTARPLIESASQRGIFPSLEPLPAPPKIDMTPKADPQKQRKLEKELTKKITILTTLEIMSRAAGVKGSDSNLLLIAEQASKTDASVWLLFLQNHTLTIFQKFWACLAYLIYYKTSLAPHTVDAYLHAFIEGISKDLSVSEEHTTKQISEFLKSIRDFLLTYIETTEAYVEEHTRASLGQINTPIDSLETMRQKAIDAQYGHLKEICKKFSKYRVETDAPWVKFFSGMQKIPVLGLLFSLCEWVINRWIIQRTMKNSILPNALVSSIDTGIKNMGPDKKTFVISSTKFFTEQLEQLTEALTSGQTQNSFPKLKEPDPKMGKYISNVVKLFLQAIRLNDTSLPDELRERLNFSEGLVDSKIAESIKKGLENALFLFVSHFGLSAKTGELPSRFLGLALQSFAIKPTENNYEITKERFKKAAQDLSRELTERSLVKKIHPQEIASLNALAQKYLEDLLSSIHKTQEKISLLLQAVPNNSSDLKAQKQLENNLVQAVQELKNLSLILPLYQAPQTLDPSHKSEIQRRIAPVLQKALKILEDLEKVQKEAYEYEDLLAEEQTLNKIEKNLTYFPIDQVRTPEDFLSKSLIQNLEQLNKHNPSYSKDFCSLMLQISKEQEAIERINLITLEDGILDLLHRAQTTGRAPEGFDHEGYVRHIRFILKELKTDGRIDKKEYDELVTTIDTGSHIQQKWEKIERILNQVKDRATQRRSEKQKQLFVNIQESKERVRKELEDKKEHPHLQRAKASLKKFSNAAISSSLSKPISKAISQALLLSATLLPCYLFPEQIWATSTLAFAGGMASQFAEGFSAGGYKESAISFLKKTLAEGLAAAAGSYVFPSFSRSIPLALAGRVSLNAPVSFFHARIFEKIQECLGRISSFSLTGQVPEALIKSALSLLSRPLVRRPLSG